MKHLKAAEDCATQDEYLCAAYNYERAERTGLTFRDENANKALKIEYATSLYMLDKQALLEKSESLERRERQLVDQHNKFFLDSVQNLHTARRLLIEADHQDSYLYVAVIFDLIEQKGACAAGSIELLVDGLDRLSRQSPLKDFADYEEAVDEVSRSAAAKLSAQVATCLF